MSVGVAEAMSAPFASFRNEERTKEVPVAAPKAGVTIVSEVQVPVGVYDPPSSRIVSAASRTVFARFVLASPVTVSNPVCPLTDKLAALPVVFWLSVGKVQLVRVPELGVPNIGVVSVGLVSVLLVSVLAAEIVSMVTPSIETTPAETLASVVSLAWPNSIEPTPKAVEVDAVKPAIGNPVQLVSVPEVGVPKIGATKVLLLSDCDVLRSAVIDVLIEKAVPERLRPFPAV